MKTNVFSRIGIFSFISFLILSIGATPAFALDLKEAKSKGLIGEDSTGYVAVIKNEEGVEAIVKETNEKRKAEYQRIAAEKKIPFAEVEKSGAKTAADLTTAGQFIKVEGSWQKK